MAQLEGLHKSSGTPPRLKLLAGQAMQIAEAALARLKAAETQSDGRAVVLCWEKAMAEERARQKMRPGTGVRQANWAWELPS